MLRQFGADLGFVPIVIGTSSTIYVLTLLASGSEVSVFSGGMNILVPSSRALLVFGMSGAIPVFLQGRWWTLLSASWIHGSLLHILFNMMWVRQLGPATADVVGPARTVIIYTIAGVSGFFLSSLTGFLLAGLPIPILHGAYYTMGASASIFGLLGALVHYGRKSGSRLIHGEAMRYAVILFVFGLIMPGVDNYAHAGGFLGGYAASAFMNPLTRERGDHVIGAVVCLAATLLAIVASLFVGFRLI